MKKLVGFALLLFFVANRGRAEEYVVARIECPAFVTAKINWNDKIGSDPTFRFESGTETLSFAFNLMALSGPTYNTINCSYKHRLMYQYKVKRKIISCTGGGERIFECKLVP